MDILIYALIAAFIAYRLYNVFGQNGGPPPFQMPPQQRNPFMPTGNAAPNQPPRTDNVLPLPGVVIQMQQKMVADDPFAPAPDSLAGALHALRKADPNFDERNFLKGARLAFEIIVHGFAAGERGTLKNMVSPAIYKAFDDAISARELRGERWEMRILHIRDSHITEVKLDGRMAIVTVQFVSDQSKVMFDRDGNVMPQDGTGVQQLTDLWTLSRDTGSKDPNWQLVATRSV